jgi:hypothetical protein
MKTAAYYQSTADAMGLVLYLYADGSRTNSRKVDTEPIAMVRASRPMEARQRPRLG